MTSRYASGMTKQIAVKLPDRLVGAIDRLVETGAFDSRSHAVRASLEETVASRRRQGLDRLYREASVRAPETPEEIAEARRLAIDAIGEEPWEQWW